jgi:hypothetical protein
MNTDISAKKQRGPGRRWVKGQSGNPNGAPRKGASWAEAIRWATEQTAGEIVDRLESGELRAAFARMPKKMQLKHLIVLRWLAAQMFDPSPGLAALIMDREDGKVADKIESNGPLVVVTRKTEWTPN